MAAGGEYPSMTRESEEVFESECFNCSQEDKHVKADVFCVECKDNLCWSCLNHHNKIARLRTHEIQEKSALKPGTTQGVLHPPTETCLHHGRLIDTYCATHDVVCCSGCIIVDHKSCSDMKYIPTVASGILTSKELQDAQTTTKFVQTQLDGVKRTRLENLTNVKQQRIEAMERARASAQQLIRCIEELEEKTTYAIMEKYKKLEDVINDDLDKLNKLIATLDDAKNQLQKSLNKTDETNVFVHLKQNNSVLSTGITLAGSCMSNGGVGCCTFMADDSIETYLKSLRSLGSYDEDSEDSEDSLVYVSDENMKSSKDTSICNIMGICSLDGGGLVMADCYNQCIKKLDKSFQVENRCDMLGHPYDVCQTNPKEVAVTMTLWLEKKIQFVSVGQTMSLTRSFTLRGDGDCAGIACKDGKLYVSRIQASSSCVQVYDMRGSFLQTTHKDISGSPIFNRPELIATNARSSNIYIADFDNGIIILDKSGLLVAKITDPDLTGAHGVCVLPGDKLLVCGYLSHNVIQFDGQGRKVRTLLTGADGLQNPRTLHFDTGTSRLLIGMTKSNNIKVFKLVKK